MDREVVEELQDKGDAPEDLEGASGSEGLTGVAREVKELHVPILTLTFPPKLQASPK